MCARLIYSLRHNHSIDIINGAGGRGEGGRGEAGGQPPRHPSRQQRLHIFSTTGSRVI